RWRWFSSRANLSRCRRRVRIVAWERSNVPSDSREYPAFWGLRAIVPVTIRCKPPIRSGHQLADPANSRLSFSNLTEAHVLDALRRQYQVELPQIRRAVNYLREHFQSPHPLV